MPKSGFEPLTDGFSIQYSTTELLKQKYQILNFKILYISISNINKRPIIFRKYEFFSLNIVLTLKYEIFSNTIH
jgi:hypothetical protein